MESGTHEELLSQKGLYSTLYEEQFDGGRVEAHCEDGIVLTNGNVVADERRVLASSR